MFKRQNKKNYRTPTTFIDTNLYKQDTPLEETNNKKEETDYSYSNRVTVDNETRCKRMTTRDTLEAQNIGVNFRIRYGGKGRNNELVFETKPITSIKKLTIVIDRFNDYDKVVKFFKSYDEKRKIDNCDFLKDSVSKLKINVDQSKSLPKWKEELNNMSIAKIKDNPFVINDKRKK
ncbi:hypothetical protein A0H76_240 [Hepatospora eriocheir]|uniref:Uncharacterized protein n=1 Tax=Hepatospora eriocheir TaxID=1081669 RepID=A0A1X0QL88_9MICR|nr:hypothetical protein A0H76_240 [Hepatospora eriocheir]